MSDYRRLRIGGGCYFFTVVCWRRKPVFASPEHIELLRNAFRNVMKDRPFSIDGIVVLPDHLHCIWRLPKGDDDFSGRWREIKKHVTRRITANGRQTIWQPRFWEHWIRDEDDWRRHLNYIHYNPVKHCLVGTPADWPYSSFHTAVRKGWYEPGWGSRCPEDIRDWNFE